MLIENKFRINISEGQEGIVPVRWKWRKKFSFLFLKVVSFEVICHWKDLEQRLIVLCISRERERERECVCVRERERERQKGAELPRWEDKRGNWVGGKTNRNYFKNCLKECMSLSAPEPWGCGFKSPSSCLWKKYKRKCHHIMKRARLRTLLFPALVF